MRWRVMAVVMCLPAIASAQTAVADSAAAGDSFAAQTQAWIDLQVSGKASVAQVPPLSGEVASHIYERWLKSFDYPIPEHFSRQTFLGGSSGSGSGSGGY